MALRGASVVTLLCAALLGLSVPAAHTEGVGGSFTSSDPLLNRIWSASVQTADDMLVPGPLATDWEGRPCAIALPAVIIDGIPRDGCPYVGDEAVIGRTLDASTPNWAVQRSMLTWFAAAQHSDGAIPASPLLGGSSVLFDYNAYWIQAVYNYVLYSGDVGLARQVWPNVVRLINGFYAAHTLPNGLLVNDLGWSDYAYLRRHGDIVAYDNAQYVYALRQAVKLAAWLGGRPQAAAWTARANRVAAAFTRAFWDPSAGAFGDTTVDHATHPQDGNAFAVLSGIATTAQTASALRYLVAHDWRDYGNTIADTNTWAGPDWGLNAVDRVYPFMSYFELRARFQSGLDDSAFDLLRREWGYMVKYGPGRMWETIGPDGGPPADIHPSFDSGWSSGAAPALSEYVLGVAPASPGFTRFTVTPHPNDLTSARGAVPTPHGLIHVAWTRTGTRVSLTVRAPAGTIWANAPRPKHAP
jgi:hypothetical protein